MGGYCSDFGVEEPADLLVKNEGLQKRIWDETIKLLEKVELKVGGVVRQLKGGQLGRV
ncbi:hypothetical protein BDV98DRAFT_608221 [Pterulicium gracile]|uniref:Uncharacterized protein n=1 Tax=Pterulicium gracile TaxID=1884261 RepID=A0A5C3Q482_9AGAR|nr:hypothetical protein BDV98DRAFT_608221 [Pterula gracilis]